MRNGSLHHLGGLQDFRDDDLVLGKQAPELFHPIHQGAVYDLERASSLQRFVQILDGEAQIIIGGTPHTVAAGEIILMPGGISHEVKAVKRFKMLLTLFRSTSGSNSEFKAG